MSDFEKWFSSAAIKNIDVEALTKEKFIMCLELAFNAGEMHGVNRIEEALFNCPNCGNLKEDCNCLEPVLEKSEYEKGWR